MPYDNFGNFTPYPANFNQPAGYQPPRQMQPQNVYAFVNGLEGAKSYMVPANQTVLLMDSEQPVCYMKTANALGQGTLRYFKLTEVSEADVRTPITPVPPKGGYVTKEELEEVVKRIEKLEPKGE